MAFPDSSDYPDVNAGQHGSQLIYDRAKTLYRVRVAMSRERVDQLLCLVMVAQWLAGAGAAWLLSPIAWSDPASPDRAAHRLSEALTLGTMLSLSSIAALTLVRSHLWAARCWVGAAQIGWSILLIHLVAGRPAAHFHACASLAILGRYRDWRVLTAATGTSFLAYGVVGLISPKSLFGIPQTDLVRIFEHQFWLMGASVFLAVLGRGSLKELWAQSIQEIELEHAQAETEETVRRRTRQLMEHTRQLEDAQNQLRRQTDELKSQAEELDRARARAEQSNIAKTMFLTNMSHEIRTPMTAILGFAELLEDQSAHLSAPQFAESILAIRRNGEHLMQILNDILDLSRIEAGRFDVERVPFAVSDIVDEVSAPMGARAQSKGLSLAASIDPRVPEIVLGDPARLRQVLINLVSNAVKFTEEGQVQLSVAVADDGRGATRLKFVVVDTGIGLTREQSQDLFQPFTQADLTTTRRYGGAGLGLAISKRLTELMGGSIEVQGTPGAGCVFIVLLPLVIPNRKSDRKAAALGHSDGRAAHAR